MQFWLTSSISDHNFDPVQVRFRHEITWDELSRGRVGAKSRLLSLAATAVQNVSENFARFGVQKPAQNRKTKGEINFGTVSRSV